MDLSLAEFLKGAAGGKFSPGYLLVGNELFFRDRVREALRKFFLEDSGGEPGGELIEHDLVQVPVSNALEDAASPGLFASRRLLWLRNAEALLAKRRQQRRPLGPEAPAAGLPEEGEEETSDEPATAARHSAAAVADYFARPLPGSVVVFEATSLDLSDRDAARKAERLEKLLPVPSLRLERSSTGQAARYLIEEARRNSFVLQQDTARELAEACTGDLARAVLELEKLMLYAAGSGRISSEQVQAVVPAESSFTLWEISDAIGERDIAGALRLVQVMVRRNTSPLLVAALIAGHVRKLLKCKEGAREWVHPKVREQARKFTVTELTGALEKLFEADVALRFSPPDERVILERLVMDLAQKR